MWFFTGYLASFMLRRLWRNEEDPFECFMKAAEEMYSYYYNNPPLDPKACCDEENSNNFE